MKSHPRVIDVPSGFAHAQIVVGAAVTVVDPGNAASIFAALDREGIPAQQVRRIVLTHGDADHWRGANALRERSGAEVIAHANERAYLEGTARPSFSFAKQLLVRLPFPRLTRPIVDRWIDDAETFDDLDVIQASGHTPGHICLRVGDALIAGDAFRTGPRFREVPRMMTSDLERSRATIRRLALLEPARAFSGHGPPADGAAGKLRELAVSLS